MRAVLRRGRLAGSGGVPGGRQPGGPAAALPLAVDLRSHTVSRPCAGVRRATARAAVGDDDYGGGPGKLQRRAAGTPGMESALFVPTATMANLIAVMCHCQRRGAQLFLGQDTHPHPYEHGGAAQVAGVHSQALPDMPNGTFDLDQLELAIREAHGSQHYPHPELICLENMHSLASGRALPLTYLRQVRGLADHYGLRVHMDSTRLMNAAVAQGVEPAQVAQHCDSVSLCFSKGSTRSPCGAVLAGCREFVTEAWPVRKQLPKGTRQAGVLAAAAHLGLQCTEVTLHRDRNNAQRLAEGIHALDSPLWAISLAAVGTNTVMVNVQKAWTSLLELCNHLCAINEEEVAETGQAVSVLLLPWSARTVCTVWHCNISARDVVPGLSLQGESWNSWPGSARRNLPWDCIQHLQALEEPEHSASPVAAAIRQPKVRTGTSLFVLQMCSQPSET